LGTSVEAVLFAGLGFGIWKMSRICALSAILLFLAGQIEPLSHSYGRLFMVMLLLSYFSNGVRGTFAYHKYGSGSVRNEPFSTIQPPSSDVGPS